jgi:hypothetical protein
VTDTDVNPSSFNGSETGTLVTLDPGNYQINETAYGSVFQDLNELGGNITGPLLTFTGPDCDPSGAGTIAAGESQTCNLENHFNITEKDRVEGKNVCVTWSENIGNDDIRVTCSGDEGEPPFSFPINISNNPGGSFNPSILVNGSNVYVVWEDGTGGSDIWFSKSTDLGQTFTLPDNISDSPGTASEHPRIGLAANGNIIVVWEESNNEIYRALSTNGGTSFGTPLNLSTETPSRVSQNPVLKVSGNTVVVAWEDNTDGNFDIYAVVSTNGGSTFAGQANISGDNNIDSFRPQIAISGSNIVIVWDENDSPKEVYAKISNNSGATFGALINISNTNGPESRNAQVAISGNNIIIAYEDKAGAGGEFDVFAWVRAISGGTVTVHNLSNNTTLSDEPKIAVTGNNVIVVWQDTGTGAIDLYAKTSINNGATFGGSTNISDLPVGTVVQDLDSVQQIVAVGGNVYVVWDDSFRGNEDIFYNKSHDGGLTWVFNPPPPGEQPLNLSAVLGTGTSQQQDISSS